MDMLFQIIVLITITIFVLNLFFHILPLRNKLSCKLGMMTSMTMSTMAGLLVGTILALNQGFATNSVLSLVIGLVVGSVIGILFNKITLLEGIIGGVMGGLMGAMLGEMLPKPSIVLVAAILLSIMILSFCLLKKIIHEEVGVVKEAYMDADKIIKTSCYIAGSALLIFMFVIITPTFNLNNENSNQVQHHHH